MSFSRRLTTPRLIITVLAVLALIGATLLGAGTASALTSPAAENRVGASTWAAQALDRPLQSVSADQRLGNPLPQRESAVATGVAANTASNAADGARLGQKLALESAESVFTSSGRLSPGAIAESRQIIPGDRLGNQRLIERLTADGSDIADWGKYTTRTHQSPSGDFQVHYYMNRSTGAVDYGYDYKVIFNGRPR